MLVTCTVQQINDVAKNPLSKQRKPVLSCTPQP